MIGDEEEDEEEEDEGDDDDNEDDDEEQTPTTASQHTMGIRNQRGRETTRPPRRQRRKKTTTFGFVEMAREAYELLTAGFQPSKQPYLAKKCVELQIYRLEKLQAKPWVKLPDTCYFVGVPDPFGLLDEGQVLIHVYDGITPGTITL